MSKTVPLWKAKAENPVDQITLVLSRFQEYYFKRRLELVNDFLLELFVPDDRLIIIGTGSADWRQGLEAARKMFEWDWEYWGNLELDIPKAIIQVNGNVGWVAVKGKIIKANQSNSLQKKTLEEIKQEIQTDDLPKEKLLRISRKASEVLAETESGDTFIWPLRFTAVLEKEADRWLFSHIQFSFSTTRLPDERLLR
ncbi:MAG: hypothetical protein JEZ06_18975 [Anaerolineaceae bacterium]|nr:hypothetical protein [Anaerolineaceae bacterium]